MSYYLGIDIGSGTSKAVITQDTGIIALHLLRSGINYTEIADKLFKVTLKKANLSIEDIKFTVATGQGANMVLFADQRIADVLCCARGMIAHFPGVRTIIDVEGQSTQVIRTNSQGQIINLITSERCAAGAGRFIDIISNVLQIPISEIGEISLKSQRPVIFTTACAVFGESEAVSRVAEGVSKEDILAGVHKALADKIGSMVDRVGIEPQCAICGGGAQNIGLVRWVQKRLGVELLIPLNPQYITAYGAAILAAESDKKK